jgi:hypothetical protein
MRTLLIRSFVGFYALLGGAGFTLSACGTLAVPPSECVIRTASADTALITVYHETCSSVQAWDSARYSDPHNTVLDHMPTGTPVCNTRVQGHSSSFYADGDSGAATAACAALRAQGLTY